MLQRIFSNDIMGLPKSGEDGQTIDRSIITENPPEDVEAREKASSPSPSIHGIIKQYLFDRVPEFRKLDALRQKGWETKSGDRFFATQRRNADQADEKTIQYFYNLMKVIAQDLDRHTGRSMRIKWPSQSKTAAPRILDMCAAPGGFLESALDLNPGAHATAFSLPVSDGGHKMVLSPQDPRLDIKFLDLTMLAEDMGVTDIPEDHPDAGKFLPRQLPQGQQPFNLVLCDGQVLRTQERTGYRSSPGREARRLTLTQLALGLEHVQSGGTMVVLLHKLEAWDTMSLLYTFDKFSRVRLFKPKRGHAKRSSFYMVASDVRSRAPQALMAIEQWKASWRTATFGTDEEYAASLDRRSHDVEDVLDEFGPKFVRLGRIVWDIQASALEKAPFMRSESEN